jgi:hypothetical protein
MQLSAELFRSIVGSLSSDERSCARHEKRKEGRVGMRCTVELVPQVFDDSGQKTLRVCVRDISPSGMGFTEHNPMSVGTELVCLLPREDDTVAQICMIVRHCVRVARGLYNIGVSFDKKAMQAALKPTDDKAPVETAGEAPATVAAVATAE